MYSSRKPSLFVNNSSTCLFCHSSVTLVECIAFLLTLKCWTNHYRLPVSMAAVAGKSPYICQLWQVVQFSTDTKKEGKISLQTYISLSKTTLLLITISSVRFSIFFVQKDHKMLKCDFWARHTY